MNRYKHFQKNIQKKYKNFKQNVSDKIKKYIERFDLIFVCLKIFKQRKIKKKLQDF